MNNVRPKHASMVQFSSRDDCLQIGGMSLKRLVQRVGRTPFYAYDRQRITDRIALLRQHLPAEVHLHYAMKANPMPAVVQHMAGLVDGLDVASAGEMKIALDTPMPSCQVSFAGPGKADQELSCAIAAGIIVNMESEQEMERIANLGNHLGIRPKVAVRVNPDFELKSSSMKMGGGAKPFGVDAERVPAMLARMAKLELDFEGFHIFSGSQNLKVAAIQESHEKTLQLGIALARHAPGPVRLLNIGGGFGVPYFPGDEPLNVAEVGENLRHLMPEARRQLPDAQVVIELGRYLIAEAGIYVCRVLERKESRGQIFLVTDGGLHHHLAASGNFGQVIRKNYPVIVGNKVNSAEREIVSVVGPLCTPLDLLADRMEMSKAEAGDLIVILQSGAYGLTASPTAFLGHPPPAEVLV
ncbi:diaminopimelate decarboxylase [Nitrosospira sp. Nsp18]|uniref:pyridoxal-dependent decarboxylase, exosortase A system-associated n=1 Tax=Nitrosospira sp. Nsp18 TaxID=1855334 RepID=UPI000891D59C|nr:pyridoxal-dependent decarboxylase, exosortase A system-associated [Nitrosospira sp. Nsp18]SDA17039.1 diaminopimelate decarboxylase [Nitrosospira sp. Nsp18]